MARKSPTSKPVNTASSKGRHVNLGAPKSAVIYSNSAADAGAIQVNNTFASGQGLKQNVFHEGVFLLPIKAPNSKKTIYNRRFFRGYMEPAFNLANSNISANQGDTTISRSDTYRYRFNFFYNPTTISYANQVYTDSYDPSVGNQDNLVQFAYPATESVGFSLLLDRTQDAYYKHDTQGTLQDIDILYKVINGDQGESLGFLLWNPVLIVFSPKLTFTGYISSLSVNHARFDQRMVPNMTTVDISATAIASPKGAGVSHSLADQIGTSDNPTNVGGTNDYRHSTYTTKTGQRILTGYTAGPGGKPMRT